MQIDSSLREPERKRISKAFRAIRNAGGITQTGLCCQSCSWAAAAAKGATDFTTVAIHHVQGTAASFPKGSYGRMQEPLHIYHGGDSRFVCEALRNEGLRVEWDGDGNKAIVVLPDLVNQ